jgi:anti-anti-sigma regulatory factor
MGSPRATLPPGELEALFPFHLAFDAHLRICQSGPRLARVLPGLRDGEDLLAHFEVVRPRLRPVTLATMIRQSKSVFLLRSRSKPLDLRGQLVSVEDGAAAFFLGSPWVTRSEQLVALGLDFSDFAVHDALADALVLMRAQQRSLEESEKLAAELVAQRSELERTAAALGEKLREVAAQRDLIRALSTPIIAVAPGVVVLPIVGTLDHQRAELMTMAALEAIEQRRARVVVLDLGGVVNFDAGVGELIQRTVRTATLLGARCVLVGLTPKLSLALTQAGAGRSLEWISTFASLQDGLRALVR